MRAQALLLLTMLATASLGALSGQTHALALEQTALRPSFASLSTPDMFAVGASSAGVTAKPNQPMDAAITGVANVSGRTIPLSLSVEGLGDLMVSVDPVILGPGQTAVVKLSGRAPKKPGSYDGIIHLYGFNQYLHTAITVSLTVAGCLDSSDTTAAPAPMDSDQGRPTGAEVTSEALASDTATIDPASTTSCEATATLAPATLAPATASEESTATATATPGEEATTPATATGEEITTPAPTATGEEVTAPAPATPGEAITAPPPTTPAAEVIAPGPTTPSQEIAPSAQPTDPSTSAATAAGAPATEAPAPPPVNSN